MQVEFLTDPAAFLDAAGALLRADPVVASIPASVTETLRQHPERIRDEDWWAVVRDESGEVVGAAMRTAPFAPHPVNLLPMSDDATAAIVEALHDRGEAARATNGALGPARLFADTVAAQVDGAVVEHEHTRLFELGTLVPPPHLAPGALRAAEYADIDLIFDWLSRFGDEAADQAGRPRGTGMAGHGVTREVAEQRVDGGRVWLWEEAGTSTCVVGASASSLGVSRIGPVYTPPALRGRGYAGSATYAVSALLRDAGDRVCLFTDQANPISNALYQRLGYEPVVDMVNLEIVPAL